MFDSQKIDSYFDGKKKIDLSDDSSSSKVISWRRVIKLSLPCVAAAILGIMVIMPNIRKSTDLRDNITLPRKNEMEKLHIEQTVFSSTDNKNRVNKIIADSVDETEAGSKIIKIENPRGSIPTESGIAEITAKNGIFNQNNNILELHDGVQAVVDNNTVITSETANYDFNKEYGWGDETITAKGDWGNLSADAFSYDKGEEILTLKGKNVIVGNGGTLKSDKETKVFQRENKTVSVGKAEVLQGDNVLRADRIVGYFTENGKKELVSAEAFGNVVIKTPSETVTGKEGYYHPQTGEMILYGYSSDDKNKSGRVSIHQGENVLYAEQITAYLATTGKKDLQQAIAVGSVRIVTPSETAIGKEGHYNPRTGEIVLYGDYLTEPNKKGLVTIKQGENVLRAEKITAYIATTGKKDLQKAIAVGRVVVKTPKGQASGDKGVYSPLLNKVELFDNVKIEQDNNYIVGAHAETDLVTSVSRITGDENTGGRIHGTFYKTRKTDNGD